jgi:hypothetical protein
VVGHTKKSIVYSMNLLQEILQDTNIAAERIQQGDFMDCDKFLDSLYRSMPIDKTLEGQIFSVKANSDNGTMSLTMDIAILKLQYVKVKAKK